MTIDQRLQQPKISTTNPQLAELQGKALEISKYVHNWMYNPLEGIITNANLFLQHQDRKELRNNSYGLWREYESFYANILFSTLHGKEEHYHLFTVRDFLSELKETMDKAFEEKSSNSLKELTNCINAIGMIERLYFRKLLRLLGQIRDYPEARYFMVEIIDDKGRTWHI